MKQNARVSPVLAWASLSLAIALLSLTARGDQTPEVWQSQSIYQITSATKITKAGKPATLADGVVGEEVGGYVKPTDDGKMSASSVRFGPKPEGKDAEKNKEKTPK